MKILLASGSPRRFELLRKMEWDVEVHSVPFAEAETVSDVKEKLNVLQKHFSRNDLALLSSYSDSSLVCAYNALGKGKAAAKVPDTGIPVLAADTIVISGLTILGKPAGAEDAKRMLRMLSGKTHQVKTAIAILYEDKTVLRVVTTNVCFRTLTEAEIEWYVSTKEPLDKAGAYGIQGKGAVLVERIEGSYDNVVGLPLATVYEMLHRLDVPGTW